MSNLFHYFALGSRWERRNAQTVGTLAGVLTVGVILAAGAYFAFLYLFAGR